MTQASCFSWRHLQCVSVGSGIVCSFLLLSLVANERLLTVWEVKSPDSMGVIVKHMLIMAFTLECTCLRLGDWRIRTT